jgi:RHS repeat-associated protein
VTTITDPLNHTVTYTYDSNGHPASVVDATGRVATFTYDTLGRKTSETAPGGYTSTSVFDGLGRVTSITLPGGRTTSFTYDANGNRLSTTDALGKTSSVAYDDAGRVVSQTDALSRTVSYTYNAVGRCTGFTDGRGFTTVYTYNTRNLLTQVAYPDSTSESWTYDARGQVATHTDGRGVTVTTTVDDGNRVVGIAYSNGTPSAAFAYDADGFRTSITDGTGTTTYGYDGAGRATSRNTPQGSVTYTYDAAGRKTSQTVGGATTTFTYDAANRLLTATSPNGMTTYGHDTVGRVVTVTNPNGTTETKTYDSVTGDLTGIWHKDSGGATLSRFSYAFDAMGRKTAESQPNGTVVTYGYDDAGQLTSELRTGTYLFNASYSYDNAGNRLTRTIGGVTEVYSYDAANKLLSVTGSTNKTYGYDNAGNVTSVATATGTTTLTWDGANRLVNASNGTLSNTFTYNGLGQRVGKADSNGTFTYSLAGDTIDSPVLADGQATYQYGRGLVSEVRGGVSKIYHSDNLGTLRTLSNSGGSVTDQMETDAFGNVVGAVGSPLGVRAFGFAGQHGYQTDTDTGLMRLGHRYYDASAGRFISRDPMRAGHNWYAYCNNDPVNTTDPTGLMGQSLLAETAEVATWIATNPVIVGEIGAGTAVTIGSGTGVGVGTSVGVGAGVGAGVGGIIGAGAVAIVDLGSQILTGHSVTGIPETLVNTSVGQAAVDWVAENIYGAPGGGQVEQIPVGSISYGDPVDFDSMSGRERRAWIDLRNDIRDNGIQTPVDFIEDPNTGRNWILDGNHRAQAAELLGHETIPGIRRTLPYLSYRDWKDVRGF